MYIRRIAATISTDTSPIDIDDAKKPMYHSGTFARLELARKDQH
jgi:hypothetical protein